MSSHDRRLRWSPALLVALLLPLLLAFADESLQQRRQRIENMSAEQLNELRRKKDRYEQLSDQERQQLQQFHSLLNADENSEQLRLVMQRYYDWLKTLSETSRARLLDASVDERIARIREIREQQQRDFFGMLGETRLPDEDISPLIQWAESWVRGHEEEIRRRAQTSTIRGRFGRPPRMDGSRGASYLFMVLSRGAADQAEQLISDEDISDLRGKLSSQAVAILDGQTDDDKRRLVHRWVVTAITARDRREVTDQELDKFFDEQLSPMRRDELDRMSPQKRHRELLRDYWIHQMRRTDAELPTND